MGTPGGNEGEKCIECAILQAREHQGTLSQECVREATSRSLQEASPCFGDVPVMGARGGERLSMLPSNYSPRLWDEDICAHKYSADLNSWDFQKVDSLSSLFLGTAGMRREEQACVLFS